MKNLYSTVNFNCIIEFAKTMKPIETKEENVGIVDTDRK